MSEKTGFSWLVDPHNPENFFASYWEKNPLYINRRDPDYYDALFGFKSCDTLLSRTNLRYPTVRIFKDKIPVDPREYIRSWRYGFDHFDDYIDTESVYKYLREGATINILSLNRSWRPLVDYCSALEKIFFFPVNANAFLTPPSSDNIEIHTDTPDNFILQVGGTKSWRVWSGDGVLPLRDDRYSRTRMAGIEKHDAPVLDVTLEQGDLLYIPRGTPHAAVSKSDYSLHVVIAVDTVRFYDMFNQCIKRAIENVEKDKRFRNAVRMHAATCEDGSSKQLFLEAMRVVEQSVDFGKSAHELVERFVKNRYPSRHGQLHAKYDYDKLPSAEFRVRQGVIYLRKDYPFKSEIEFHGKRVSFGVQLRPALDFALNAETFSVDALPGLPSPDAGIDLVKTLLSAGLIQRSDRSL